MRSVILDVDGVVVHGFHANPDKRRPWDVDLESDLGISRRELTEKFFMGAFASDVVTGRRSLIEVLDEVLPGLGHRGSSMSFVSYWLERDSVLDATLLDALACLRRTGIRVFLATNQEHIRASHMWTTLGLHAQFDDIFYSARLGVTKPHAAFFEAVSARIGPQQETPLFFDDSARNVDAARTHGWDTSPMTGSAISPAIHGCLRGSKRPVLENEAGRASCPS